MCGICGAVQAGGVTQAHLQAMNDTIVHRGPDGEGYHLRGQVGLAMRRLAIIDVSGSDQPLYNEDHSVALVFNGEIFNYRTLRADLIARGHTFHTDGDGETIAHLYEIYGRDFPQHLRGQFAVALWDEHEQTLILARDRFGQKPLYYYHDGDTLIFGSEIKALLAHPAVPCHSAFEHEPDSLALYLSYGYIPAPLTAFEGIRVLEPGHTLRYHQGEIDTRPYWSIPTINPQQTQSADIHSYAEQVREALREATRIRMIADVPLGAFLSGGLDSSLIVALMQAMSNQQVKTFSIGFSGDESFDETAHARDVATYLGTDHTAFTVEPQAMSLLQKLVWHHDQPFADSSAIPTYLVSEMTRQHVTVALTGDGGDELFAGYDRFYAVTLLRNLAIVPRPLWGTLARLLGTLPEGTDYYNPIKRARRFLAGASQPLAHAYFDWVRVADGDLVQALTQRTDDPALAHFDGYLPAPTLAGILTANQRSYLPDDLLIKADRCSMATSLEARAPFLDHVLAEQVASIPLNLKLRGSITKYVLKESARGLLPDHIIDRKKHGFGVPLGAWLRDDIRPVRDMLLDERARQRGLFDHQQVTRLIDEHANHQRDHNRILWTLLTLENWYQTFID